MKKSVRIASAALAACCLLSMSAGCASNSTQTASGNSNSNQKVTLTIYTQYSADDEKQPYDYALAEMKKEMPNVSLKLEIMAQDDNQKLKTYAATNNLPDIFNATTDVIESFKKSNNILQLDKYVTKYGIADQLLSSAQPLLKNSDGHTYAIPDAGQFAALIYYNKSVFAKCGISSLPTNYDEFLADVKKIKAKNIVPLALFGKEKWPGVQLFDMLASRENINGIKDLDNGKAKATDTAYVDAANKLVALVKAGLLPIDVFNVSADDASAMLEAGKAAMNLGGAWGLSDFNKQMGDNVGYMYCPLAAPDKAESVQWNLSGGGYNSGLGVNPKSKNADIAAEYTCKFALAFAKGRIIKRGDPNPILKENITPEKSYSKMQQQYVNDSSKFKTMTCYDWGLTNSTFKAGLEDEVSKLLTGTYPTNQFIKNLQSVVGQ